MTKPKRMEPVKAWATIDDAGIYEPYVFHTRSQARADMRQAQANADDGKFRIARVEIREIK